MKRASSSRDQDILRLLKEMKSRPVGYPPDLLAARRAAFMDQLDEFEQVETAEGYRPQDREIVDLLGRLRSVEDVYPARLLAARRSAFARQIFWLRLAEGLTALRSAVRERLALPAFPFDKLRTSLILAGLVLAAAVGYFSQENRTTALRPVPEQAGISRSGLMIGSDAREVKIICRPGYEPPLCLAGAYKKGQTLTYHGNGSARPAVAKDTFAGVGDLYRAAFVNDGLYGPGASWISASPNSWIKIDLGKPTAINTITFGRDRLGLGEYDDGDPGQFVIQVAIIDDVYEDGDNSNDSREYRNVFDSEQAGFNGTISGAETVTAQFDLQVARYIKITFENAGTAIDEVEAFVVQPPMAANSPTKARDEEEPPHTATPVPSRTERPVDTATPLPTSTPVPTDTPVPTHTPIPTDTPTPIPSDTPVPTDTPIPLPTDTALPEPTDVVPLPEVTPLPEPFDPEQSHDWPPGLERNLIRPTQNPHFSS
jgi:hypothetical protein